MDAADQAVLFMKTELSINEAKFMSRFPSTKINVCSLCTKALLSTLSC